MGVLELVDLPPPPSSCRPKTYSRSISNRVPDPSSSSSLNKPFKSPLPAKAASLASLSGHQARRMAIQSSPVASSSRLPPASMAARRSISPNGIERELNGDDAEWDDEDDEAGGGEVETPMDVESSETEGSDYDSDSDEVMKPVIHVEAHMAPSSAHLRSTVRTNLLALLRQEPSFTIGPIEGWRESTFLSQNLVSVKVTDISNGAKTVVNDSQNPMVHVYKMSDEVDEYFAGDLSDDDDDDEERGPAAASSKSLPSSQLDGLWENLIYPGNIKDNLMQYMYSSNYIADKEIDPSIVGCNRLVLLHGPPGTGKTSLCRAYAQKAAIRFSDKYSETKLVEINSHSLFSKWFSESGKLVQKLFSHVTRMVESESTFVVVMIDEVESLTSARTANGSEPGDALRVVNALLTQLDKLKGRENVLVLTTSNLSHTIDPAFIDRADIIHYVPLPPPQAVYWIIKSCFEELMNKGAMRPLRLHDWGSVMRLIRVIEKATTAPSKSNGSGEGASPTPRAKLSKDQRSEKLAIGLVKLARKCHESKMSGRVLRRMPLMAHVRYMSGHSDTGRARSAERWLGAMSRFVEAEQKDRAMIGLDKAGTSLYDEKRVKDEE